MWNRTRLCCCLFVLAVAPWTGAWVRAAEPMPRELPGDEFFERQVRPLLTQHCVACHGKGQSKGGFSVGSRDAVLTGGDSGTAVSLELPEESLLIQAVEHRGGMQMPPNGKLTAAEIQVLRRWVEIGLPWSAEAPPSAELRTNGSLSAADREFWSFRPITNPPLPEVQQADWPKRSLDAFVLAKLEEQGLHPAAEADRRTYIRRVAMTLTGLLPTSEEVDEYVADTAPDAEERLVDRWLNSPHYGERWARHWLDVARYGEDQAHTFRARLYPEGYRYRDWVTAAFNRDLPYDQFVIEQIAGDLLPAATPEERRARLPALGFFALGPVYYADAGCADKAAADEIDDRIDTLCRGFLGLTVSCARCHDHKFDPISTEDYYALAGVFASTEYRETPLVPDEISSAYDERAAAVKSHEKDLANAQTEEAAKLSESFVPRTTDYILAALRLRQRRQLNPKAPVAPLVRESGLQGVSVEGWSQFLSAENLASKACLTELNQALASGLTLSEDSTDGPVSAVIESAARRVEARLIEALIARQMKEAEAADKSKVKLDAAQSEVLKTLLTDKSAPFFLGKGQAEKIWPESSRTRLEELEQELATLKQNLGTKYPVAHALTEREPVNLKVHLRGNPKTLGDEVPRRFLPVLSEEAPRPFEQGSGRMELALAIARPENPLTARVIVNRVWQQHFGRGLVGTASNFGLLGERPTHSELLDHLASRFIASGWSLKQLHREILLSATFRMSSEAVTPAEGVDPREVDPDNFWLWRQNRRRFDFEAWRDAALRAGGNLDLSFGGPSLNLNDQNHRRRTLYSAISRHDLNATLRLFDYPDPNLTSERRSQTTVPMQQLYMLNSGFMVRQAQELSRRALKDDGLNERQRIERLYQWLFQRAPSDREMEIGLRFIEHPLPRDVSATDVKLTAWEQYAQALLATNEFTFLD
ncbi:DUF1549 domain-containing protein [bacterium]|nr:DUF1549 domain-containing protein [bacterium]